MSRLKRIVLVTRVDLLRRVRNRSALVTAFAGPLAMAAVFSLLLGNADEVRFRIGLVDLDRSEPSRSVLGGLLEGGDAGPIRFEAVTGEDDAREQVDDGDLDAALVVPAGFAAAARGGEATIRVLRAPTRLVSGQVAEAVAGSVAAGFDRVNVTARTAAARTAGSPAPAAIEAARRSPPPLTLAEQSAGSRQISSAAFFGASMSVLFLFFTTSFAARSVLAEQRSGTLGRVLATPTSAGQVITGKVLSVSLLGLSGFVTVWAATTLVFGADWGAPLAVVAVMAATVLAVGGVASFVAALGRSEQQADAVTAAVTFVLALLGGNFLGPGVGAPLLRRLALLTPNGWSLRAFTDLAAGAAPTSEVVSPIGVLLVMGVVSGAVGLGVVRRKVAS